MKYTNIQLSKDLKSLEIHVLSDWHIGDPHCNMKSIIDKIEYIKNTENAYAILNGDLLNNATKTSVSDIYAETIHPMDQLKRLSELLTPIKDKILLVTIGNHEFRTYKNDGIDLMGLCTRELGISNRYVTEGGVLFLEFGTLDSTFNNKNHGKVYIKKSDHQSYVKYSIYVTHGSGGGRKEGGKINRLVDLTGIVDTDIYIHSHTHLPAVLKENFYRTVQPYGSVRGRVEEVTKLFVNTSSSLEYGGYGQTLGYKPSSRDNPVIYLSGIIHDMKATL